MTDRAFLFSAPMVVAIDNGSKTQTRRIAKPRSRNSLLAGQGTPDAWTDSYIFDPGNAEWLERDAPCKIGDTIWVKENYRLDECYDGVPAREASEHAAVWYEAGGFREPGTGRIINEGRIESSVDGPGKLRPSIFMRRCWSRLSLRVLQVRLERLNACSQADAVSEGLIFGSLRVFGENRYGWKATANATVVHSNPIYAYSQLWNDINGPTAWQENPLVWVIIFERKAS